MIGLALPSQAHSVAERYLQRVFELLHAAGAEAGWFVHRGRVDAHGIEELPALNVRRGTVSGDSFGSGVGLALVEFEIDHLVRGDDWESAADRLHMRVDAALQGDPALGRLGKGLRCIRTEPRAQPADEIRGSLSATYQFQSLHRRDDLSAPL